MSIAAASASGGRVGARASCRDRGLFQPVDQFAVLGMHQDDSALAPHLFHGSEQERLADHHAAALVGQEHLAGAAAARGDFGELGDRVRAFVEHDMEREIDKRACDAIETMPFDEIGKRLIRIAADHADIGRDPTHRR
jgi:hypothetical protein